MKNPALKAIQITGPDAETFLQGQCTCDIRTLNEEPLLSACCNRKGRMLANFWIWREGDAFYLQLPSAMIDMLIEHLQKYVVFSKVTLEAKDDTNPPTKPKLTPVWILPEISEQFTPQMLNLQKHGGVSFTKGCYVGQEIIARTENLGTLKRHLYRFTINNNGIHIGDAITNSKDQKMGTVVAVLESAEIFAVIEDRAVNESLQCNGSVINEIEKAEI